MTDKDKDKTPEVTKFDPDRIDPNTGRKPDFDTTPETREDGHVILSQDIRDEQEAAGFAPDIQPKIAGDVKDTPVERGTYMMPTGNIVVEAARQASTDEQPDDVAKRKDSEVVRENDTLTLKAKADKDHK